MTKFCRLRSRKINISSAFSPTVLPNHVLMAKSWFYPAAHQRKPPNRDMRFIVIAHQPFCLIHVAWQCSPVNLYHRIVYQDNYLKSLYYAVVLVYWLVHGLAFELILLTYN